MNWSVLVDMSGVVPLKIIHKVLEDANNTDNNYLKQHIIRMFMETEIKALFKSPNSCRPVNENLQTK